MSDSPDVPDAAQRKPFAQFLQEQRGGALHGELSDVLAELALAVADPDTKGKGKIAIEILLERNPDGATLTITDKVKVAEPEKERGAAIFFYDDEGNLMRRDPRQMELPHMRDASDRRSA